MYSLKRTDVGHWPDDRFNAAMVGRLNDAIADLNSRGIAPTITAGFRDEAEQVRMRNGGSKNNPASKGTSLHQLGFAVDVHLTGTVRRVFEAHGFKWGGTFRAKKDPPHFQQPGKYADNAGEIAACAAHPMVRDTKIFSSAPF